MKKCPVCGSACFDDMEVCFGCLHRFGSLEEMDPWASMLEEEDAEEMLEEAMFADDTVDAAVKDDAEEEAAEEQAAAEDACAEWAVSGGAAAHEDEGFNLAEEHPCPNQVCGGHENTPEPKALQYPLLLGERQLRGLRILVEPVY